MTHEPILACMQRGQWQEAIALCQQALLVTPTSARLQSFLGICYFRLGQFAEAVEPFRRATILDPNCWEAGLKLAQCLDRLKRYEEAYVVAKEWLQVEPNDPYLQGLVHGLESHVRGNRQDGWEQSRFLDRHNVRLASDE